MRELKFRVWDKSRNNWLSMYDWFLTCEQPGILHNSNLVYTWRNFTSMERVCHDNFIEQQFTGLKDKNGKEIYEGDILLDKLTEEAAAEGDGADIGRVFFAAGAFMIDGSGTLYDQTYSHSPDRLVDHEVIGNIFENPELLIK